MLFVSREIIHPFCEYLHEERRIKILWNSWCLSTLPEAGGFTDLLQCSQFSWTLDPILPKPLSGLLLLLFSAVLLVIIYSPVTTTL